MFLRHSLALPEDHVITKEAEASVMLTASVSSASAVSGLEIRVWSHHFLEYVSVFNFQLWNTWSSPALRVRDKLCILQLSSVHQRSVILHQIGTCFPGFLCCSFHLYPMEQAGSDSFDTVNRHRRKCIQEAKRLGVIINTFPCLSLLGVSALVDTRGMVSRDSARTRRMTGNRRRIWCETGSGKGGQQDDGRREEERTHHRGGENKSEPFRKGPKIFIYLGVICSICVLILLCIDKYSVIHYTGSR